MKAARCIAPHCPQRARHLTGLCVNCRARKTNDPLALFGELLARHEAVLIRALWDAGIGDPARVCEGLARAVERLRQETR